MQKKVIKVVLIISFVYSFLACEQDFDNKLSERIEEIKRLKYFDNSIVVFGEYYDSINRNNAMVPYWKPEMQFYMDDNVRFLRGIGYQALVDNKGKKPSISPKEWQRVYGPHPYLYLRDSVSDEKLKNMAQSENVYLRMYAFAALWHHNEDGLFDIIKENLKDTTKIDYNTADVGDTGYPVDLMIEWKLKDLTADQRQDLIDLILQKYPHLKKAKEILVKNEIVY